MTPVQALQQEPAPVRRETVVAKSSRCSTLCAAGSLGTTTAPGLIQLWRSAGSSAQGSRLQKLDQLGRTPINPGPLSGRHHAWRAASQTNSSERTSRWTPTARMRSSMVVRFTDHPLWLPARRRTRCSGAQSLMTNSANHASVARRRPQRLLVPRSSCPACQEWPVLRNLPLAAGHRPA